MKTIYQYTSLKTLALILENKTIRFSNLEKLADPLEKYVKIKEYDLKDQRLTYLRHNYGKYCFVSCLLLCQDLAQIKMRGSAS